MPLREHVTGGEGGAKARTPPRGVQHPKFPPVRWQRGCASGDLPPGPHPAALSIPAGRARPQLVTPAAAPASTPSLLYPTWSLDTDFFFFFFSMGGSQTVIKSPSLPPAPAPISSSCCLSKGNPLSSSLSFIIFFFFPLPSEHKGMTVLQARVFCISELVLLIGRRVKNLQGRFNLHLTFRVILYANTRACH